ncbi:sensor histidine kinase [Paenibacillus andongensis]|uniref:sensor histidine kinase n=1 Tax=Paenibacillus andongensis TaxID=2975482 RepID=UPI0021BABA96|nr:sensor histidine kinase [Paenibacillus andongensis]
MTISTLSRFSRHLLSPFNKSLRYKLMLIMVAIAVLPLSLVTLFATKTTKQSLSLEVIRSNESRMEWAGKYFNEKFDQLQAISYSVLLDKNLFPNTNSSSNNINIDPDDVTDSYIKEKLRALYIANNSQIARISLYMRFKQQLFIADKDAVRTTSQLSTPSMDWETTDDSFESVNIITNVNRNFFSIVRSMNRFEDREVLGGVSMDVRWQMMNSVLDMLQSESSSQVFIVDSKGNMMYDPYSGTEQITVNKTLLEQIVSNPTLPGYRQLKEGFLFYQPVASDKLWLIKFIPMSYVTHGASSTLHFSFVTAVIFIGFAIAVSVLTAYFTTKPIIRLTKSMRAVEFQNFDVGVSRVRRDEIGTLERRFNSMLLRIKELIQTEYKTKIEKRTAQLKAMQAQINPHFLYNALQAIGGIALDRKVPEIYEHVRAISELFRYTIRMKSDLVTVTDELEHVSNYLHIQNIRFHDTLTIHMDIDEECRSCQIPKFSLQPIVENCFKHGLEDKMGTWSITIRVQMILDEVEISIEDNGIGIPDERLWQIRKQLTLESDDQELGDSLGMSNIHTRIKMIFGGDYGLYITSEKDAGTTVKLVIPSLPERREEIGA